MITKYETKILKGISVLGMVILHLFDRMDYAQLYAFDISRWKTISLFIRTAWRFHSIGLCNAKWIWALSGGY